MKTKTIILKNNQIALVLKARKLVKVLTPGHEGLQGRNKASELITIETDKLYTDGWQAELLAEHQQALQAYIVSHAVQKNEIGLLYVNNLMCRILCPGQQCFIGKSIGNIELKRVPVREGMTVDPDVLWLIYQAGVNGAAQEKQHRMNYADLNIDRLEACVSFYI